MTTQIEALRVALKTFEQIENHPRSIWDCSSEIELLRCAIDELSRQSEAPVVPEGYCLMPVKLNDEMRTVLTNMLTHCHTVDESYAELLTASHLTTKGEE